MQILVIFLAGGTGCVARFLMSSWLKNLVPTFPIGTLAVNFIGSFLIGFFLSAMAARFPANPLLQAALVTGFLGGFTTFSAFSYETVMLFQTNPGAALLNAAANVGLCMAAVVAGAALGRM